MRRRPATTQAQVPLRFSPAEHTSCPACGQPWRGCIVPEGLRLDLWTQLPDEEATAIIRCYLGRCGGL